MKLKWAFWNQSLIKSLQADQVKNEGPRNSITVITKGEGEGFTSRRKAGLLKPKSETLGNCPVYPIENKAEIEILKGY